MNSDYYVLIIYDSRNPKSEKSRNKFLIIYMSKKMTAAAASRIQSATAKSNGGKVSKGSFAARATSAAAKATKR